MRRSTDNATFSFNRGSAFLPLEDRLGGQVGTEPLHRQRNASVAVAPCHPGLT